MCVPDTSGCILLENIGDSLNVEMFTCLFHFHLSLLQQQRNIEINVANYQIYNVLACLGYQLQFTDNPSTKTQVC